MNFKKTCSLIAAAAILTSGLIVTQTASAATTPANPRSIAATLSDGQLFSSGIQIINNEDYRVTVYFDFERNANWNDHILYPGDTHRSGRATWDFNLYPREFVNTIDTTFTFDRTYIQLRDDTSYVIYEGYIGPGRVISIDPGYAAASVKGSNSKHNSIVSVR